MVGWRNAARRAVTENIAPHQMTWRIAGEADDMLSSALHSGTHELGFKVSRRFLALAEEALLHREPGRFALMYRLLWRLRAQPGLLDDAVDDDVWQATRMAKQVHRDIHKMHAFLRFKEVSSDGETLWLAWFEPDHHILEAASSHFADRFASLKWSIFTPERSVSWTGAALVFGPGASRESVPENDRMDEHWRTYYRSIFNPARLKVAAMTKEMPKKYWRNMPETREIAGLVRAASGRTQTMIAEGITAPSPMTAVEERRRVSAPVPAPGEDPATCARCPIGAMTTQAVYGEGPADARLMIVGEQPGDQEDLAGRPFVGPAGKVLDDALRHANLDRRNAYVTNAVKHFKFEVRGKRRLHKSPSAAEIDHCRWWLNRERAAVKPKLIIALGGSAARGVTGRSFAVGRERGRIIPLVDGAHLLVTVHPSYLLRLPDENARAQETEKFISDLTLARIWLSENAEDNPAHEAARGCDLTSVSG
ncbi:MAG: UdgX family uracil-DNA binding protein [Proteobacteria bacterium]|nr:UdgX family uracil-DNA binding protein [Pseudomonadota bacterium]